MARLAPVTSIKTFRHVQYDQKLDGFERNGLLAHEPPLSRSAGTRIMIVRQSTNMSRITIRSRSPSISRSSSSACSSACRSIIGTKRVSIASWGNNIGRGWSTSCERPKLRSMLCPHTPGREGPWRGGAICARSPVRSTGEPFLIDAYQALRRVVNRTSMHSTYDEIIGAGNSI